MFQNLAILIENQANPIFYKHMDVHHVQHVSLNQPQLLQQIVPSIGVYILQLEPMLYQQHPHT